MGQQHLNATKQLDAKGDDVELFCTFLVLYSTEIELVLATRQMVPDGSRVSGVAPTSLSETVK
jgi:hypothetical protein